MYSYTRLEPHNLFLRKARPPEIWLMQLGSVVLERLNVFVAAERSPEASATHS